MSRWMIPFCGRGVGQGNLLGDGRGLGSGQLAARVEVAEGPLATSSMTKYGTPFSSTPMS